MTNSLSKIVLIAIFFSVVGTGQYYSKKRIPIRIANILSPDHPVQKSYVDYANKYDSGSELTLIVERAHATPDIKPVLMGAFERIHYLLGHDPNIKGLISLSNAEFLEIKGDSVKFKPFLKQKIGLSEQANQMLQDPLWKNVLVSDDLKYFLFSLQLNYQGADDFSDLQFEQLLQKFKSIFRPYPQLSYHLVGSRSVEYYLLQDAINSQQRLTPLLLGLLLLLVFFLFRDFKILLCFALCLVFSNSLTTLCIYFKDFGIKPFTGFALFFNLIVATSDLIHFFSVYQKTPGSISHRIQVTKKQILAPCFLTTLTTVISFTALIANSLEPIWYIGFFSALASLFCFLITFYLLPHFLKVFQLSIKVQDRLPSLNSNKALALSVKRPFVTTAIFIAVCFVLVGTSSRLEFDDKFYDKFIDSHNQSIAKNILAEKFNYVDSIDVQLQFKGPQLNFPWTEIHQFEKRVRSLSTVSHLQSPSTFYQHIKNRFGPNPGLRDLEGVNAIYRLAEDHGLLDTLTDSPSGEHRMVVFLSDSSTQNLQNIMNKIEKEFKSSPNLSQSFDFSFNGHAILRTFITDKIVSEIVLSLGLSLAAIFLVFLIAFRRLSWAFLGMIPNIMPIIFITGLMGALGITVDSNAVLLVCITLGIAVDDTIHFLWALKKQTQAITGVTRDKLRNAFQESFRPLVGTTLVFALSFPCFFLADLKVYYQVGFFVISSLIVALIADLLVLPAIALACSRIKSQ